MGQHHRNLQLKIENKLLREKIDVLNSTNDKILNSVYWTIGTILAVLIGLSVWNSIKTQKLNDEKFKEHIENTKKELTTSLTEQIDKKVGAKSFSDISSIKSEIYNLKNVINSFKQDYIIDNLKYHPYYGNAHDSDKLFELIELVTTNKMVFSYEPLLETIKSYLKDNGYIYYANKPRLLTYLDEYFQDTKYKYQVTEIKTLLANLKE